MQCRLEATLLFRSTGQRSDFAPLRSVSVRRQESMKDLEGRIKQERSKKSPREEGFLVQRESGTDLLSRGIPRTIIGAAPFHGPVRDGKAWFQSALGSRHSLSLRCFHNEANSKEAGWDCIKAWPWRSQGYRVKPHGQLVPVS